MRRVRPRGSRSVAAPPPGGCAIRVVVSYVGVTPAVTRELAAPGRATGRRRIRVSDRPAVGRGCGITPFARTSPCDLSSATVRPPHLPGTQAYATALGRWKRIRVQWEGADENRPSRTAQP